MYINEQKIESDLASIRAERTRLQNQIESLDARESGLVEFLSRARSYADVGASKRSTTMPVVIKPGALRPVAKSTIGGRARARRIELGLSQQKVADQVGCSNETVSSIELNRSGVSNEMRTRVLKTLGLTSAGRVSGRTTQRAALPAPVEPQTQQHTIVAQAVAAAFEAGTIINGRDVYALTGDTLITRLKMPDSAVSRFTPTHLIANLLMLEARQGGILERVSSGHYRVLPNASETVEARIVGARLPTP